MLGNLGLLCPTNSARKLIRKTGWLLENLLLGGIKPWQRNWSERCQPTTFLLDHGQIQILYSLKIAEICLPHWTISISCGLLCVRALVTRPSIQLLPRNSPRSSAVFSINRFRRQRLIPGPVTLTLDTKFLHRNCVTETLAVVNGISMIETRRYVIGCRHRYDIIAPRFGHGHVGGMWRAAQPIVSLACARQDATKLSQDLQITKMVSECNQKTLRTFVFISAGYLTRY